MHDLNILLSIPPTLSLMMDLAADAPGSQAMLWRKICKGLLPRLKRIAQLQVELMEAQRPRRRGRSMPRSAKRT